MAVERQIIPGVVRNGVVVPDGSVMLPEGAHVEIVYSFTALPSELQAEMDVWEQASEEAWQMIETWEKETKHGTG